MRRKLRGRRGKTPGLTARKRWRQGYKLEELIREICLIRRNFIDTCLKAFADVDERFNVDVQNAARRVVEGFFDNVIIEATVQFVEERQEAADQLHAELKSSATTGNPEFIQHITHLLREPGPLLIGLEVLLRRSFVTAGRRNDWAAPARG